MKIQLKVMADYGTLPLWLQGDSGVGPVDPNDLPISNDLRIALQTWSASYNRILNHSDPSASNWPNAEEQRSFVELGRSLAQRLKVELGPESHVLYFDDETGATEAV